MLNQEPKKVFHYFHEINQIPRASYHEQALVQYIVSFAKERNLEYFTDKADNIIVKKEATPGFENHPVVILQGHLDMVPEKTAASTHNFDTDAIEMIVDGEWLHAKDTTLGADNGIAVAMMLAVLDSNDIQHGPIECLFTAAEELGMDGARGLDASPLQGKYLLNIDTEVETEFIVSCAGGVQIEIDVPLEKETPNAANTEGLRISIDGLIGGHSGIEIHKQRANANQLMARLLHELAKDFQFQLAYFDGGTKHNAIPNVCQATLAIRPEDKEKLQSAIATQAKLFANEFSIADPDLAIHSSAEDAPKQVYAKKTTDALLSYLFLAPHGVIAVSLSLEDLVETSLNLAIVRENEQAIHITAALRSSQPNALHYLAERFVLLADVLGIKSEVVGSYPGWEYEPGSELEKQAVAVYEKVLGSTPKIHAVHAGLECGILKEHLPNTEMISFGPDIENAHTPKERVRIASVERIYTFLLELLKTLK